MGQSTGIYTIWIESDNWFILNKVIYSYSIHFSVVFTSNLNLPLQLQNRPGIKSGMNKATDKEGSSIMNYSW